ncbi:hypothetical protein [Delftia acidovorans]|uniref:hypothetical protein n=1 Tax=Delftia acidovorans TaxID=80866 RepID=UPI001EE02AC5|nr:hypothetical protein [Delftia acidovorans]MCG3780529.1 hypothetical protein [Delftia acidovorans]
MSDSENIENISYPPLLEWSGASAALAIATFYWINSLGGLSLGWDTLNHHLYLGWMAIEGSRLQQDVFAAGSMSCQYPFAYGPLYFLQSYGASGQQAAIALAIPSIATAPAVWLITWSLIPQRNIHASLARISSTALAYLSPLWWSLLDSTSNDILSSLPIIWAFSLVIWKYSCESQNYYNHKNFNSLAWTFIAGVLATTSIVLKMSNIFAGLGLLVLSLVSAKTIYTALARLLALALGGLLVTFFLWWPWAQQIWRDCGSPFYPMFTDSLRPLSIYLP